jgi:hypothetical protein
MLVMPLEVTNWDGSSKKEVKQGGGIPDQTGGSNRQGNRKQGAAQANGTGNRGQPKLTINRQGNRGQPKLTISFSIKLSKFFALKSP